MDPRDTAPDSWELEEEDAEAQAVAADLQASFAALNVNAKPFVPNVNAAVFVPSFFQASPAETPAPVAAPDPVASMEVAETAAPVENGSSEAKMTTEEETWEQKEEPGGGGGGGGGEGGEGGEEDLVPGGACEEGAARIEEEEEMMEEEEEEMPMPKVAPAPPNAPKKEHVNVVFIGHVDAGKSTIGGQIMYLTGMVEKRTLEKYEREAKEKNRETW
ncbi:eukaryotic peptide chain release factor GTP-binding subunit ERF3A-like isoform X4 [Notothenia coriiceps]|uniref:Eukaryotic peptide chain release factor GTP-binding subunit ERF3A-like isoform X4 n=1 Tax=Notothenia coriiceps TaxID=8208 RepID=A0A6I9MYB2_9TELE|nr:PREDICTED: eukaryotic peptide chain release factor GTP-binding subunit ERF3A-like isoform X4 [Notothenia coriiceps]